MATTVVLSVGSRTSDSVTVNTVTSTTVSGYANAWSVVLAATVPTTTKIGDKLTTSARDYLITNISSSTLTVVGDPFSTTTAPSAGSGATTRAFPSTTTWASSAPANLTTQDAGNGWIWKSEIYKEGTGTNNEWQIGTFFSGTFIATFTSTTNASSYFIMTAAAGQSFADNAGKLTNALRYNPANGVAINNLSAYAGITGTSKVEIYNLQITIDSLSNFYFYGGGSLLLKNCILYKCATTEAVSSLNCLWYGRPQPISNGGSQIYHRNSTFIGTGAGNFGNAGNPGLLVKNCTFFAFTGIVAQTDTTNSTYNATDLASFGWSATGNIVSKTFANQFENIGSGTEDFRVKTGADLINAGVRDQTYTNDLDIVGSARSITTPTIGAWEFPSVTYTYARPTSDITTQWTPSTGTDHFALIDETTANDADYIYATAAGQTDEVKLASMTAPQAGTDLKVNYRVQGIVGSASVTLSLVCGTTVIATDTARTFNGDYTLNVPSATWSPAVTDWTNMRLRFVSA